MTEKKFDVCIVGLKCYDHLRGASKPKYVGGIEKQLSYLAKSLAKSGVSVAFVTYDEGQESAEEWHGVTIFPSYPANSGLRFVRLIYPQALCLIRAIRGTNAPVILQMGAGFPTGVSGFASRFGLGRRKFVFLLASDGDARLRSPLIKRVHERVLHRFGLRLAHKVLSQTSSQASLLASEFGIESPVRRLPSAPLVACDEAGAIKLRDDEVNVVWVGRISPEKRPDWLLAAAKKLPRHKFHIVGSANTDSEYQRSILRQTEMNENVTVHGRLSDSALAKLYGQSTVLCCTSLVEGFPTTFLEAWRVGLPVVSTFDPDGIIQENQLGVYAQSIDNLVTGLEEMSKRSVRDGYSNTSKAYFKAEFSPGVLTAGVWQECRD